MTTVIHTNHKELYAIVVELHQVAKDGYVDATGTIHIRARSGAIELEALDLYRDLHVELEAQYTGDFLAPSFDFCVDATLMKKILKPSKGLKDNAEVLLAYDSERHRCSILADGVEIEVETIPYEDYPASLHIPTGYSQTICEEDVAQFHSGLEYVIRACSPDEGRPHLNGVLLGLPVSLISTDGHRLHRAFNPLGQSEGRAIGTREYEPVLPLNTAKTLLRLLLKRHKGSVLLSGNVNDHLVGFTLEGSYRLVSRYADARFPPYQKVLPKSEPIGKMTVEVKGLKKALAKLQQVTTNGVGATLDVNNGSLMLTLAAKYDLDKTVTAKVKIVSSSGEIKPVRVYNDGTKEDTGVNAQYLIEALPDEELAIIKRHDEGLLEIVNESETTYALVMPFRL